MSHRGFGDVPSVKSCARRPFATTPLRSICSGRQNNKIKGKLYGGKVVRGTQWGCHQHTERSNEAIGGTTNNIKHLPQLRHFHCSPIFLSWLNDGTDEVIVTWLLSPCGILLISWVVVVEVLLLSWSSLAAWEVENNVAIQNQLVLSAATVVV